MTNCIKGLKNVISSQKSGEMAFFWEKVKQVITYNLEKIGSKWYNSTKYVTEKNLYNICKLDTDHYKTRITMKIVARR